VLVEPQPTAFHRLRQTYADQPQVTLVNAAIAERPGTRTLYCPRQGDAMVSSFDRRHLVRHGIRSSEIVARSVSCHTVAGVLEAAGMTRVDLLQIDTEGYDYQILQSIDFAAMGPVIVRFEFRHMSRRHANACIKLLAGHGYRFLVEASDIIAYRAQPEVCTAAAA
jgi:FkbM family methyltransferase